VRIEVVHEHPERRLLRPAFAAELGPAWRSNGSGGALGERGHQASLYQRRASAGGAPAPRRPAARTTIRGAPRPAGPQPRAGRPLTVRDRLILAGVVLTGGVLAPPLLLWGLERSSATTTALLLNLEVVFTVVLAGIVFGEHLSARVAIAAGVMAVGGIVLGWTPGDPAIATGAAVVTLACFLWALDNNLTRLIAEGDPLLIVEVKGLVAGTVNILLALASGQAWPSPGTIGFGMALGAMSYGTSLVLFILAMRELGAARAGAYFSTAPFFGAAGGLFLLGESPTLGLLAAAALMALATWLLLHEHHLH